MTAPMPGLLFLCVANSARSQMAEGLARARFGDTVRVQSAGSHPSELNPFAAIVMEERGIPLTGAHSKSVDVVDPTTVNIVVTLCAEEVCPTILIHAHRLHWPVNDPAGAASDRLPREQVLERFRDARDAIDARLGELDALLSALRA